MVRILVIAWILGSGLGQSAFADDRDKEQEQAVLYQVGKNGSYCLSITPNESGCISGTGTDGETVNLVEFIKGKQVVFRNLSDAPHDMRFSGTNAEDMAPQAPNAADAAKRFGQEDPNRAKISCSFHGAQLAVGYKVLAQAGFGAQKGPDGGEGHKDPGGNGNEGGQGQPGSASGGLAGGGGRTGGISRAGLSITGLADVSREVLAKGRPQEVEKLVAARPELMEKLKELRPLLAAELAPKMPLVAGGLKSSLMGSNALGQMGTGSGNSPAQGPTGGKPWGGGTVARNGATGPEMLSELADMEVGDDSTDNPGKPKRRVLPGGAAAVVFGKGGPTRLGDRAIDKARGLASAGGTADRMLLPMAHGRTLRDIQDLWKSGHAWLILILLAVIAMVARAVIGQSRTRKQAPKPARPKAAA